MMNIDTAVCILCQTQLFCEKRNAVPEFRYSRQPTNEARAESNLFELCLARRRKTKSVALSNVVLGMVICGGEKRKISVNYCSGRL